MATIDLPTQAAESNPPTVNYTSQAGEHIDLNKLRLNLEIIADDIDMAEFIAEESGDTELARALNELFYDVEGMLPAVEQATGGRHE